MGHRFLSVGCSQVLRCVDDSWVTTRAHCTADAPRPEQPPAPCSSRLPVGMLFKEACLGKASAGTSHLETGADCLCGSPNVLGCFCSSSVKACFCLLVWLGVQTQACVADLNPSSVRNFATFAIVLDNGRENYICKVLRT